MNINCGRIVFGFFIPFGLIMASFCLAEENPHTDRVKLSSDQFEVLSEKARDFPQKCIRDSVRAILKKPEHPDRTIFVDWNSEFSSYTEVAIAEFLIERIEDFREMDEEDFCRHVLFPEYLKGYREAVSREQEGRDAVLAPLGSDAIDAEDLIIQLSHNYYFKHYLGHSDITRKALKTLNSDEPEYSEFFKHFKELCHCKISKESMDILAKATQLPDIYKWDNETYHAHSPSFPNGVKQGLVDYIEFLIKQIELLREDAANDTYDAVIRLGGILHMIQDLVYHHGITLAQHSGLAYIKNQSFNNPDFPPGSKSIDEGGLEPDSEAKKRWNLATRFSIKLILLSLKNLGKNTIRDLFTIPGVIEGSEIEKERNRKILSSISYVFCNVRGDPSSCTQQISTWKLFKYYLLNWKFSDPYLELLEVHKPFVPWDPQAVFGKIEFRLNGDNNDVL